VSITRINNDQALPEQNLMVPARGDVYGTLSVHHSDEGGWKVFLVINPEGSDRYYLHGPARSVSPPGTWEIPAVPFGEGFDRGQRFVLRAIATESDLSPGSATREEWVNAAEQISARIYVTVLWRPPEPTGRGVRALTLSTIGGCTIDPQKETVVPRNADVEGAIQGMEEEDGSIYLLLRPVGAERWRVHAGPASVQGDRWTLRDVRFEDPGEVQWLHFEVMALWVRKGKPLPPGPIDDAVWRWDPEERLTSFPVRVAVESKPFTTETQRIPRVRLDQVGRRNVSSAGVIALTERYADVQGTVDELPEGARIYVLLYSPATNTWWGPAGAAKLVGLVAATAPAPTNGARHEWLLPAARFDLPGEERTAQFQLMAVVSYHPMPAGAFDFAGWRDYAVAISPSVRLDRETFGPAAPTEMEISISTVASQEVGPDLEPNVGWGGDITGAVEGLPPGASVYVALHPLRSDQWYLKGPAFVKEGQWLVPDVDLVSLSETRQPASGVQTASKKANTRFQIVAFVARSAPPADEGDLAFWQPFALAVSPMVRVLDPPEDASPDESGAAEPVRKGKGIMGWVVKVVLLFAGLVGLAVLGTKVPYRFPERFHIPRRLNIGGALLGFGILGLAIWTIVQYYPLYSRVLHEALFLPTRPSQCLAIVLIVFGGLAGVLFDTFHRLAESERGSRREAVASSTPADAGKASSGMAFIFSDVRLSALMVITPALWIFQALLYGQYYALHTQDVVDSLFTRLVPFTGGLAALFISFIETLAFYTATLLTLDFLAWVLIGSVYLVPLLVVFIRDILRARRKTVSERRAGGPVTVEV
jgi:hypothetical protein